VTVASPLFDTHVVVDWSARSSPSPAKPSKDAIWIGIARDGEAATAEYYRTRIAAMDALTALLTDEVAAGRRVLCGFDIAFGYPAGVAARICGRAEALALWDWFAGQVEDDAENRSNRFAVAARINGLWQGIGPFWGRPASVDEPAIPTRASERHGDDHPPDRRLIEARLPVAKTVWQLSYNGAVGSQVIMGLPHLAALRRDAHLSGAVAVWPFETGLSAPDAPVVLVEMYLSMLRHEIAAAREPGEILDRVQVRVTADHLARADRAGTLAAMFGGDDALSDAERDIVVAEEGWVLGLGHEAALRGVTLQ